MNQILIVLWIILKRSYTAYYLIKKSWKVNFIPDDRHYDFEIILARAKNIRKYCGFGLLSCTDLNKKKIYINLSRWNHGSKASMLNLDDYRIYLINHEVGHILGLGHAKPIKGKKVPVMNQHTLGIGEGLPNMWPLKSELCSKY